MIASLALVVAAAVQGQAGLPGPALAEPVPTPITYAIELSMSDAAGQADFWAAESPALLTQPMDQEAIVTLRGVLFPTSASVNNVEAVQLALTVSMRSEIRTLLDLETMKLIDVAGGLARIEIDMDADGAAVVRGELLNGGRAVEARATKVERMSGGIDPSVLEAIVVATLDIGSGCTPSYENCLGDAQRICGDAGVLSVNYSCNPQLGVVACGWTCKGGGGPAGG